MARISELLKDERPREIIQQKGIESLSDSQLMSVLIHTGTKDKSAIEISTNLISDIKGIQGLCNISFAELLAHNGIGAAKACTILASIELGKRISHKSVLKRNKISSPHDIGSLYMEELRYKKNEIFRVVFLNTKNIILGSKDISQGSLNASIVHPREVFLSAIKMSSHSIIVLHNHPSGDPNPSQEDIQITQRLKDAGKIIGIALLDHIIIGNGIFVSLKEKGYI